MPRITSTAEMREGCPVQVVDLDPAANKVEIQVENLRNISQVIKETGADSVCIVAIMGTYRTGKSFILDLLMRYLRCCVKNAPKEPLNKEKKKLAYSMARKATKLHPEIDDPDAYEGYDFPPVRNAEWRFGQSVDLPVPKWITDGAAEEAQRKAPDNEKALTGFEWQGGMNKCTQGIWIYSTPFVLPKDGKRIAVVMMDTQGAWDGEMTKEQSATIFGLTALLASKLIYNMQNMISEEKVDNLDYFTTFAEQAVSGVDPTQGGDSAKLFGDLEFLVRDWPWYEDEMSYEMCAASMEKHLGKMLGTGDGHEEVPMERQEISKRLAAIFRSIGCFGLPHPGKHVLKPSFKGDLKMVESDFVQLLEELSRALFAKDFPKASAPLGTEMTPDSFENIITQYVHAFRDNQGSAINIRDAFVQIELAKHRDQTLSQFEVEYNKLAPLTSVVEPRVLHKQLEEMKDKWVEILQKKITPLHLKPEDHELEMEKFKAKICAVLDAREQSNAAAVGNAQMKLVATPVVGCGAYVLAAHYYLWPIAAVVGGILHFKRNKQRLDAADPDRAGPAEVVTSMLPEIKGFFIQRWSDIQAMSIAASNFNPSKFASEAVGKAKQAGAIASVAAAAAQNSSGNSNNAIAGNNDASSSSSRL